MELAFSLGGALGRGGQALASTWSSAAQPLSASDYNPRHASLPGLLLTPFIRLTGRLRDTVSFASNLLAILSSFPAECETMIIVRGQRNVPGVPTPVYFKLLLSDCLGFCVKITINLSTRELSSNKYSFSHRLEKEM